MDMARARALAERLHAGEVEEDGTPLLAHIRRVARDAAPDARALAWLHETLESGAISESALLMEGLTMDELRALRLLALPSMAPSDRVYLAHLELIARASGRAGQLARAVKLADLTDRIRHPRVRPNGWSPPYARALRLLEPDTGLRAVASDGY